MDCTTQNLDDSIKAMGLKSILTEGHPAELLKMADPPRTYKAIYVLVQAYLGRIVDKAKPSLQTSAAMDLGSVAATNVQPRNTRLDRVDKSQED